MAFSCILVLLLSGSYLMVQGTQITLARETIQPDDDILLQKYSAECPRVANQFSPKCNKFSAAPLDAACWCQCETSAGKNTFFEPNNTCVPVAYARQTSGCNILFAGETTEGLLTFFPSTGINEKTVMVPVNKTCSLQYGGNLYLQYLDCDGSWKEITHQSANDSLEVTPGWSIRRLQVRSKPGATFFPNISGRILRMALQCRHLNNVNISANSSTCAMFKVEGRVTCPLPQQSPKGPSATLPKPTAGELMISEAMLPLLATTMQTSRARESPTKPPTDPSATLPNPTAGEMMISKTTLSSIATTKETSRATEPPTEPRTDPSATLPNPTASEMMISKTTLSSIATTMQTSRATEPPTEPPTDSSATLQNPTASEIVISKTTLSSIATTMQTSRATEPPTEPRTDPSATLPNPPASEIVISKTTLPPLATTMQTSRVTDPPTDKAPSPQPTTRYLVDNALHSTDVTAGITVGSVLFVIIIVSL